MSDREPTGADLATWAAFLLLILFGILSAILKATGHAS
jgi:hypothetical protein